MTTVQLGLMLMTGAALSIGIGRLLKALERP